MQSAQSLHTFKPTLCPFQQTPGASTLFPPVLLHSERDWTYKLSVLMYPQLSLPPRVELTEDDGPGSHHKNNVQSSLQKHGRCAYILRTGNIYLVNQFNGCLKNGQCEHDLQNLNCRRPNRARAAHRRPLVAPRSSFFFSKSDWNAEHNATRVGITSRHHQDQVMGFVIRPGILLSLSFLTNPDVHSL